jgi:hypothetical protein
MITDYADVVASGRGNNFEEFKYDLMRQLSIEPNFDEAFFKSATDNQIADKIADAITYLHTESVRQAGLFEISGNKEIVSMLTDKEFIQGLHPTQYRYKQILSKLLALQSTKGLILVAR